MEAARTILGSVLASSLLLLGGSASAATVDGPAPVAPEVTTVAPGERTSESASVTEAKDRKPAKPIVGRNAVVLGTHARIPDWGLSLGYQRVLGQRFSVGASLEYVFQARGYWHLQGVGETLSGQVWLGRAFHGVFAEASLTAAHQFLVRQPSLSTTSLVPGLGLGFRWTHRSGLTLGASGGLRWGRSVVEPGIVCSRPKYCPEVREGAYARITADVGFVF